MSDIFVSGVRVQRPTGRWSSEVPYSDMGQTEGQHQSLPHGTEHPQQDNTLLVP